MLLEESPTQISQDLFDAIKYHLLSQKDVYLKKTVENLTFTTNIILPGFQDYLDLFKQFWLKNYAIFQSIRIIDWLFLSLAESSVLKNVEELPPNWFFPSQIIREALFLLRFLLERKIKELNQPKLKEFEKKFNIFR